MADWLKLRAAVGGAVAVLLSGWGGAFADPAPDSVAYFEQKVQPIFVESCLDCHGPDDMSGGLGFHNELAAFGGLESGERGIVPGDPDISEVIRRVTHDDADMRMPPSGEPLSDEQIATLTEWIDAGATWADHWAYRPIERPDVPELEQHADHVRNPIDAFVLARLEQEGVAPSAEADRYTLIRRLYYDLVGLPPTPEEVEAFVNDDSPRAYEALVDELLASPHFGERWGRHWLDIARYADSDGYEKDNPRPDAYLYRDWVIDAINADMPYDQFTIEQLAGDLLPEASEDQHLATAFHRQTLTNTEGGTDPEEFRVEAVVDRTNTTGTAWLGLTVACAECHTHKYDEITHAEYFGLYAFFNSWDETTRPMPTSPAEMEQFEQATAAHQQQVAEARAAYDERREQLGDDLDAWAEALAAELASGARTAPAVAEPVELQSAGGATLETLDDQSILASGENPASDTYTVIARVDAPQLAGLKLEALPHESLGSNGPGRTGHGNFVVSGLGVWLADSPEAVASDEATRLAFVDATATHEQDGWGIANAIDGDDSTGWAIMPRAGEAHTARLILAQVQRDLDGPLYVRIELSQQYGSQHTLGRFRLTGLPHDADLIPAEVAEAVATAAEERTDEHREVLLDFRTLRDERGAELRAQLDQLEADAPEPPLIEARVLAERDNPRQTHIHERGDFMAPGDPVEPHTPAVLHDLEPRDPDAGPDRLDLARWIMDDDNPLTARVAANHLWMYLFGEGLVRTPNDFGIRGDRPSHPDLLDYLATEYRERGWSRKDMIRHIVTSATYRQEAQHRSDMIDHDPLNKLLYRQNRLRVEGEIVRDITLAAAGLLSDKVGGPSVFPPMPPDVASLSYADNFRWETSEGEDRYRRGMYTFFKRTAPHPDLMTFDCPDANTTRIQRRVSNTPLQALTLLNNEVYVEGAQALARRVLTETDGEDAQLERAIRLVVARPASEQEIADLRDMLQTARDHYASATEAQVQQMIGDRHPLPEGVEPVEVAAWTATARIVLNLDEFITRP